MSNRCLVLNKSYIPIETCTWKDAFRKIFNGLAYAIEFYKNEIIRTPTREFLKPAVIVCNNYNGVPSRNIVYSKQLICQRDKWTCMYCGKKVTSETCSVDHIVPRSKNGKSTFKNTVCACKPCNSKKSNKTLAEAKMKLLCTPQIPKINPIRAKFSRTCWENEWVQYIRCHI